MNEIVTREDPTPELMVRAMGQMQTLMQAMAESLRLTNVRMEKLERQIELMTPLTRAQEKALGEAIHSRAVALCAQYRLDPWWEGEVAAEIRKHIKRQGGVRATRELPRIEYSVLLERVALWDDYTVMRAIRQRAREERT